ncbi:hypothetical protein [Allopusillimonas ginsengisoli]|uniref:hypothetical protein n=1 Tax=Allopusillimonas ginsengisoli TaxID=453575 RepID=UPI001020B011|nr:hypothetical protein [Allopusillimonas ginsengisoli]TEA78893.1 hypothetical protein ERE07_05705 [Allopusillimonas ginsengisoli]
MIQNDTLAATPPAYDSNLRPDASFTSGVSWAAIFAGAAAAAALSLILLMLGMGLGFSAISPWSQEGVGATTFTISTAIWLAFTQILASALGGYLAGRLRVKWRSIHDDEVYFRDTAHGMMSWAVATLVTAAFLGSALSGLIGSSAQIAGKATSGAVATAVQGVTTSAAQDTSNPMDYFVDALFRSDQPAPDTVNPERSHGEASTILLRSLSQGELDASDKTYLAGLIARQTGISQTDAEQRIDTLYKQAQEQAAALENKAKEAADAARKAAATAALWMFVSLLCGAFFASLAAIWGGRRRDMAAIDDAYPLNT